VVGGGVGAAAAGAFAMGARERSARLRQKPFVVSISEETSGSEKKNNNDPKNLKKERSIKTWEDGWRVEGGGSWLKSAHSQWAFQVFSSVNNRP